MITCPKCGHARSPDQLSEHAKDVLPIRCPNCGAIATDTPATPDDPMATLPGPDAGMATLDAGILDPSLPSFTNPETTNQQAANQDLGNLTIDESTGAATIDLSTVNEDSMATLDAPTVGADAGSPALDDGNATIDVSTVADNSMATLDIDSSRSSADPISPGDPNATRDADPTATAAFDLTISAEAAQDISLHPSSAPGAPNRTAKAPPGRTHGRTVGNDNPMTSIGTHTGSKSIRHVSVSNRKVLSSEQETIGNADYQLLHKLGEGAMGVVYAARQCSIDRIVAIKAIKKTNETQRDSRDKFLYEAQITGDLDHPNIVPIHELGENDDGTLFYAMKMVSGTPWQKVIRTRSREENVETLMKVADAIAFSHSKRVIHRDLKPENIMLGSFGEVLVMDWGLAVPLDQNVPFGLGGTPAYMAPEMASHNVAKIGPASDIYLLGAILFQIVTGVPPHPGNTGTECLLAAVRNRFVDISTDDALLSIARRAMESEPSDRYPSVLEFQEAIREYKRHAESIAITGRSRQLARAAKEAQDYEGFSRAIFGFQDALVLWSDNHEAQQQLQQTKLDYASCALGKSDFDLCLGTLVGIQEPWDATANKLRQQAEQAKQARLDKERRFVLMRRVLAAVVLLAVTSLSGLSLFLYSARNTILTQNTRLEKQRNDLEVANRSEQNARKVAESARSTAEAAAKSEAEARRLAENSLKAEQQARAEREVALKNEQAAKAEEVKQRMLAQSSAEEAVQARNAEALAAQAARRGATLARLGEYQTGLNLALSQTARNDLTHSQQQLRSIAELEQSMEQPAPMLRNWLYRRVSTLNNADLAKAGLLSSATCISTWPWLSVAAIGDHAGNIYVQSSKPEALGAQRQLPQNSLGQVIDVALAPDASLLVSLHRSADGTATNWVWKLAAAQPTAVPLAELHHAALQQCEFSPDGQFLLAGNSGGLAVIPVDGGQLKPVKRLTAKGQMLDLSWEPGPKSLKAIALMQQATEERLLIRIDLQNMLAEPAYLPEELASAATCVAMTNEGDVLLGDSQGHVFQLQLPPMERSQPSRTGLTSQSTPTVTSVAEIGSARQAAAITEMNLDDHGNLLIASDSEAVAVLKVTPDTTQWTSVHNLLGLTGSVRSAAWIDKSQSVMATDERGGLMHWNLAEQLRRHRLTPQIAQANAANANETSSASLAQPSAVVAAVVDEASQWVTTCDRDAALQRWHLSTGEVARLGANSNWSFVGHTPGAPLHDWSIDRNAGLLATSCRLTAKTAIGKLAPRLSSQDSPTPNFEFCVWDLATGNMRARWQHALTSGGRIALANSSKVLIVTDAERTLCFDLQADKRTENAGQPRSMPFGAALVVPNPQASHQVMLLRTTGAGLVWDVSQPGNSPPEQSRDFNLAAANRFAPLDGMWDRTGRRFYCLLENGQIGRFLWDGNKLTFDRLSAPDKTLACNQQTQAWQCIDMNPAADAAGTVDSLQINLRERNQANGSSHTVRWPVAAEQPSTAVQAFPVPALPSGTPATDLCALSNQELLLFDNSANAFRLTKASNIFKESLGRTDLIEATADRTGLRWIVLGQHDQLWQIDRASAGGGQATDEFNWQRKHLPLSAIKSISLSADGKLLSIRHASTDGINATVIDLSSDKVLKRIADAECVAWHPSRSLLACAVPSRRVFVFCDMESQAEQTSPWPESLADVKVDQLRFFTETWSGNTIEPRQWLMSLVRNEAGHQLDFVVCPDALQALQWRDKPIQHNLQPLLFPARLRQLRASPTENIFITGDDGGSVSVWFAAPSIAPAARELTTLEAHRSSPLTALQFSSDGQAIFTAAANGEEQAWSVKP